MIVFSSRGSGNNFCESRASCNCASYYCCGHDWRSEGSEAFQTLSGLRGKATPLTWWATESTWLWKVVRRHVLCALGEAWQWDAEKNGLWSNSPFIQPASRAWRKQCFLNGRERNTYQGKFPSGGHLIAPDGTHCWEIVKAMENRKGACSERVKAVSHLF